MDPPAPETLMRALEQLNYIGALDDEGELTHHGEKMAEMPLDPLLSKILLTSSDQFSCVNETLSIVAMLNVPNVFIRPRDQIEQADREKNKFAHPDGDHLTLLNVFNAYIQNDKNADWCWNHYLNSRALSQANSIREQLIRLLVTQKCNLVSNPTSHPHYYRNIKKAILSGFFMQTALL
jgi:pre-mRNA-splicing factor ATP-dependent RNA helicase DHX15/PRP43